VIDSNDQEPRQALELKAQCLQALADQEKSLIARNIFLAGVRQVQKALGKEARD